MNALNGAAAGAEENLEQATLFALRAIVDGLHESGAIGEKNVRAIIRELRGQRGTIGGDDDEAISNALDGLADGIEADLGFL